MKQINIYALGDDFLKILAAIEEKVSIKYTRTGHIDVPEVTSYAHFSDLTDLGTTSAITAQTSPSYLVCNASQVVNLRRIDLNNGEVRYTVDQLVNPDSVVFQAGGLWSENVLLSGRIVTNFDSSESQTLMKMFAREIRKSFKKVRAYWVGTKALEMLDAGKRLTISGSTPIEAGVDLKRE